ncbi:MAG: iron sulfur protein [Actinomycetia bacterium]|nr:iron sulfur protein [Actinomycetes bacterium]
MTDSPWQDRCATRRGVLLGAGLAGVGGALAGCSTAAVPYNANEQGQAPGAVPPAGPAASHAAGGGTAAGADGITGTLLGHASQVPVGGGTIFTAEKVVVTQPVKGRFKAFSAICTHVGCLCDAVASGTIDCPCHGSKFSVSTGAVVAGPATRPLAAATIAVTDGEILLQLPPGGRPPCRPPVPPGGTPPRTPGACPMAVSSRGHPGPRPRISGTRRRMARMSRWAR